MNNLVREKLRELIVSFGTTLANDPKRLEGLLKDYCASYRKEVNALVNAAREGIPAEIIAAGDGTSWEVLALRLTRRIEEELNYTEEAARWAVESWAAALGIKFPADPPPPPEPPVKVRPVKPSVQSPIQPPSQPVPGGKQRNVYIFLKGALAVAVACLIVLLIAMQFPSRRKRLAFPAYPWILPESSARRSSRPGRTTPAAARRPIIRIIWLRPK